MLDRQATAGFYQDRREQVFAFSKALNQEYHRLANAGCAVIQIEEPCLHNSEGIEAEVSFDTYVEAFNPKVRLRRKDRSVVPHLLGRSVRAALGKNPTYRHALPYLDRLDVDVVTIEAAENDGAEIADVAGHAQRGQEALHRRGQSSLAAGRAARRHRGLIRTALKSIRPERLLLVRYAASAARA